MAEQYKFFWGGPFSQWTRSSFTLNGLTFSSCEQYMMYKKAELFNDNETAGAILETTNAREQKALGRAVSNFNDAVWMQHAYQFVVDGNRAKFTQNQNLAVLLEATKGYVLVEASPHDRRWGIGMSADAAGVDNPANWKGENLLGKALTQVRKELFGA